MERNQNYVELWGVAAGEPVFSHENHTRRFDKFPLRVERLSGQSDVPVIVASEALLRVCPVEEGQSLRIVGQLRSFNNKSGHGNRLVITVFAQSIEPGDGSYFNRILLSGALCKKPVLRRTPLGRSICDVILAVNRHYGRADYLPSASDWRLRAACRAAPTPSCLKTAARSALRSRCRSCSFWTKKKRRRPPYYRRSPPSFAYSPLSYSNNLSVHPFTILRRSVRVFRAICSIRFLKSKTRNTEREMARIFLLKGDIANPGYVDIPEEATTVREAIYGIGGGIPNGKKFKAVQIGGPSGGLLVEEHLDLPLHFQKLKPYGVRRGDSVITVLDEDRCMVDVACRFMQYTQTEFCGKCVPCREGTKRMNELLWAMRDYRLSESDFHMLTDLGEMISVTAFCNLGRNSYHTLETAIKYFPEEFKDHLRGDCALCELDREPIEPGGLPYNRIRLEIDPSICRGCSKCSRSCHAEAITGVIKSPFVIDPEKCVKCYTCIEACPFDAIQEVEIDG